MPAASLDPHAGAKTLLWSLDGTLRYIPIAALSPDGKTYLVEKYQNVITTPKTRDCLTDADEKWNALGMGVSEGQTVEYPSMPNRKFEINALPATKDEIEDLFDYLDVRMQEESCIHNLRFAMQFLMERRLDMPKVMSWLNENGGYCDCEVLQNIEPNWFRAFEESE